MLQQFRGQISRDDSVAFPESTLGLNLLTSPSTNKDADVDIVAVHGLGGDSCSTWKGKNGKIWLKDFLPAQIENPPDEFCTGDKDGRKVRVMTFGYDSNIFAKAAKVRSMHFAEKLLSSLSDRRTGDAQGRPLIIIGHSLGGIVIKKALNFAKMRPELYGDILRSVVHVCFFGTPHQGTSSLASLLRGLGSALTRGKDGSIIKELELWSAPLQETNQFFIGVRDDFSITSFWETEKYCGVKVVEEGSATLGAKYEKRIPLDRDHINMCKFESIHDPAYRDVFSRLYNEIVNIGTPTQVKEQEERIKRLLDLNEKLLKKETRDRIIQWLNPIKSLARPVVTEEREPDTNLWFLDSDMFESWYNGTESYKLLHGQVGCGKTNLLTAIADRCRQQATKREIILTFYLSSTASDRSVRMHDFLRTFLFHLIELEKEVPARVRELFDKHRQGLTSGDPSDKELQEVIEHLIRYGLRTIYLLIDGLDEIKAEGTRNSLLRYLKQLASLRVHNCRMLATSRPEDDILSYLETEWIVGPISPENVREDIEIYVKREVERNVKLKKLKVITKQKILSRLAGPGQTMFRLAALQLEELSRLRLQFDHNIDEVLNKLPSTIEEVYDNILREIRQGSERKLAHTVLQWLTLAQKPLTVEEVIEACTISLEEAHLTKECRLSSRQLLRLLPNLVNFEPPVARSELDHIDTNHHYAVLSHFSVKEYLLGKNMAEDIASGFRIDAKKSHTFISRSCVLYLYKTNTLNTRTCPFALRLYAWNLWVLHAVSRGATSNRQEEVTASDLVDRLIYRQNISINDFFKHDASMRDNVAAAAPSKADVPRSLMHVLEWLPDWRKNRRSILQSLLVPYFFEEYYPESSRTSSFPSVDRGELRLIKLHRSNHWFERVRCSLFTTYVEPYSFEAISSECDRSGAWLWVNGIPIAIGSGFCRSLEHLRSQRPDGYLLWSAELCSNNELDVVSRYCAISKAKQMAIFPGEAKGHDASALNILKSLHSLIRENCPEALDNLKDVVQSNTGSDLTISLRRLFEHIYWSQPKIPLILLFSRKATIIYGDESLPYEVLQDIALNSDRIDQLLERAIPEKKWDIHSFTRSREWARVKEGAIFSIILAKASALIIATRFYVYGQPRFEDLLRLAEIHAGPHFSYIAVDAHCRLSCAAVLRHENNLDLFSALCREDDLANDLSLPSWASFCCWRTVVDPPEPLLRRHLLNGAKPPISTSYPITRVKAHPEFHFDVLILVGYLADKIVKLEDSSTIRRTNRDPWYFDELKQGRRACHTQSGFRGLVPRISKKGDTVAVIYGGKTPYILRKRIIRAGSTTDSGYTLIGEALIQGIIDHVCAERHTTYIKETIRIM